MKGKSSNPDYEQTTIFLPRQLKRRLQRFLLEDYCPFADLSELLAAAAGFYVLREQDARASETHVKPN